ncbi:uncharacterized protein LAJ45_08267 [Morchella importuna]|uniref:uncharacterized protein n=1 Tax=Morchella importuna TaxID=1174673 RepID=UPI001E8D50D5|nr:uncharacterized protein LAJ45_08267 [Morchella importuna]KAH8147801.1 hypothetical protein LAJ45_08267 [Morchella importuna]
MEWTQKTSALAASEKSFVLLRRGRIPDPMDTELGSCGFTNIRLSTRSQWTCRKPLENEVGKNLLGKAGHTACDCGQRERRLEPCRRTPLQLWPVKCDPCCHELGASSNIGALLFTSNGSLQG